MFIEFQIGNFRSFRDVQRFSLQASPLRPNDSGLEENNVFEDSEFRLLKSKAIYGSNASGKSNLAKAIFAFTLMVSKSVTKEDLPKMIWDDRFKLITEWDNQPVFFQYIFLSEGKIFRYGFQILDAKVSYEWLFGGEKNGEKEYFMRNPDGLQINEKQFKGTELFLDQIKKGNNEIFRPDSLFLTAAALNGNKLATKLRDIIRGIITVDGVNDGDAFLYAIYVLEKGTEEEKSSLNKLLSAADTGIEELEIVEFQAERSKKQLTKKTQKTINDNSKSLKGLFSLHSRYDEKGNFYDKISVPFGDWESEGTGKLLSIGALVLEALKNGRTLIVDEFDARFHSNLTLKILELFHDKNSNPKNAQIIFVTHDTGLLRRAKLRRDQICFVNKDYYGLSSIRTLIEYKGVRKDASYEKEYLSGNYSAVPSLDEIDRVIKHKLVKK
ncbi:MAG: ATP-binding protein [Ferruginibacter sp.]